MGGDPQLAERRALGSQRVGMAARMFAPALLFLHTPQDLRSAAEERRYPGDQLVCAQELLSAASKAGKTVQLVDINQPGGPDASSPGLFGPNDLLPVAVRPDGRCLVGTDAFTRGAGGVRRRGVSRGRK